MHQTVIKIFGKTRTNRPPVALIWDEDTGEQLYCGVVPKHRMLLIDGKRNLSIRFGEQGRIQTVHNVSSDINLWITPDYYRLINHDFVFRVSMIALSALTGIAAAVSILG